MIAPSIIFWCTNDDSSRIEVLNEACNKVATYDKLEHGLDELGKNHYDAILISSFFKNQEIEVFLKKVKKRHKNLPVIICRDDYSSFDKLLEQGATDCIVNELFSREVILHLINFSIRNADIVRQKRESLMQLKRLENRISTIVGNTPIILFMLDSSGVFKMGLGKLWERFKVNKQFVLGQKIFEVYNEYPAIVDAYNQAIKGDIQSIPVNINDIIFEIVLTPVFDNKNEVREILGLAHDVTERARSEMSLMKAKKLAENAARMRQEFIANMSHEIRTPMNAIVGFTNLLEDTEMNDIQDGYVHAVKVSSESLLGLINTILDFSKIESGQLNHDHEAFDLRHVINSIDKVLLLKIQEKKILFKQVITDEVPRELQGDSNRLYQVLSNLLANSVKFTEKGEVILKVDLVEKKDNITTLSFTVTDTGIGIPSHMIDRVFDSFIQVNSESNRKYGGTGLGLSIVKKIVRQLKGTIKLTSKLREGTTFVITIPFKLAENFSERKRKIKSSRLNLKLPEGLKILLVEDNIMNQKLVLMILKDYPVTVELAENGVEAIKALKINSYDIVLMDIQMPEMDGIEVTKIIRNKFSAKKKDIPIIAMTAHAFQEEIDKCMMVGMNNHVLKPIDVENFIETINSCLVEKDKEQLFIDLSYLNSLLGNDQTMITEIINTFKQETPELLAEMRVGVETNDSEKIAKMAHKAKASFKMFGMEKAVDALVKMEIDCKTGDLSRVEMLEEIIVKQFNKAVKILKPENVEE
ncbi:MAG: signal transduction histidine kinase/CheY-like chemotaxis protein [Saprospiraceae bacterium]|jgi:signal transduction histidine kinase/CheY-like chemotaxis protein/HPt (histidine-containing phosphotransfer) domain-containing protein